MAETLIDLQTDDGTCPTRVYRPDGDGPWPGVLFFMDGLGMRPAVQALAARLAREGFFVLLPDLFYRAGAYTPPEPAKIFGDPEVRAQWFELMRAAASAEKTMRDTRAFLDYLAAQPDVKDGHRIGVTGYCMGGRMSLAAAGTYPDRIAAAAAYHPGGVATDAPDSPHLLAPKMRARIYVAGASDDASFDDAQKQRLEDALTAAGVDHVIETYPAKHGWVPSDTPVHDAAQAARHWETLLRLFRETL